MNNYITIISIIHLLYVVYSAETLWIVSITKKKEFDRNYHQLYGHHYWFYVPSFVVF